MFAEYKNRRHVGSGQLAELDRADQSVDTDLDERCFRSTRIGFPVRKLGLRYHGLLSRFWGPTS